jgi:hypothetical protein
LELLAPNPAETPAPGYRFLGTLRTLTPFAWLIHVSDVDSVRTVLIGRGLSPGRPQAGSRVRPDGRPMSR